MGLITRSYSFVSGEVPTAAEFNVDINQLFTLVNGQLDASNVDESSADGIVTKNSTQTITGAKTFSAVIVATGGLTSGSNIVSDTDSTDDLGTTSVRWANLYVDSIGDTGQRLQFVADSDFDFTTDDSVTSLLIDNSATDGDAVLGFQLSGTSIFTLGVDDGDSDKFKIGTTAIGTGTWFTWDGTQLHLAGNMGIGIATPDGELHVFAGSAGSVTANASASELVVEDNSSVGISILGPDAQNSRLVFGSASDNLGAMVQWNHDNDLMTIGTQNTGGDCCHGGAHVGQQHRLGHGFYR